MRFAFIRHQGAVQPCIVREGLLAPIPASLDPRPELGWLAALGPRQLAALSQAADEMPAAAWLSIESAPSALAAAATGRLLCLGLNYAAHAQETGHAASRNPPVFLRLQSSLADAGDDLVCPKVSDALDYEAELLAIVGKGGRYIPRARALEHVFGYTCFNDGSVRDYQMKSHQWTPGKNFDRTGPIGPVIVTADELPPGAAGLRISCRLNGETVQDANTSQMIMNVAAAIEAISEFMAIRPGDMIAMGTPDGVGLARKPPLYMKDSDVVEVDIERLGVLRSTVRKEP